MAHYLIYKFGPVVYFAILVLAIIAARRRRLLGLWVLVLAAFLAALYSIRHILLSPVSNSGSRVVMWCYMALEYVPFIIAFVALCGFLLLALNDRRGEKTNV